MADLLSDDEDEVEVEVDAEEVDNTLDSDYEYESSEESSELEDSGDEKHVPRVLLRMNTPSDAP